MHCRHIKTEKLHRSKHAEPTGSGPGLLERLNAHHDSASEMSADDVSEDEDEELSRQEDFARTGSGRPTGTQHASGLHGCTVQSAATLRPAESYVEPERLSWQSTAEGCHQVQHSQWLPCHQESEHSLKFSWLANQAQNMNDGRGRGVLRSPEPCTEGPPLSQDLLKCLIADQLKHRNDLQRTPGDSS